MSLFFLSEWKISWFLHNTHSEEVFRFTEGKNEREKEIGRRKIKMMRAWPHVHTILFGWTWNSNSTPVLKLQEIYLGYLPWAVITSSKLYCISAVLSNSTLPKHHCLSITLSPSACYICSLSRKCLGGKPQIKKKKKIKKSQGYSL